MKTQRNRRRSYSSKNRLALHRPRRLRLELLEQRTLLNGSPPDPHGLFPGETFAVDGLPSVAPDDQYLAALAIVDDGSWNAAADFSATNNPNNGWASGVVVRLNDGVNPQSPVNGEPFGELGQFSINDSTRVEVGPIWYNSEMWDARWRIPSFWKNTSTGTAYGVQPGQISLHPSSGDYNSDGRGDDAYEVLRWTAPRAGLYEIDVQFYDGHGGETEGWVYKNLGPSAVELFHDSTLSDNPSFSTTLSLNSGETVDIAIGAQGSFLSDNTPVDVTITSLTSAVIDSPVRSGNILAGDSLRFSGRVSGGIGIQSQWDFGDGRTSGAVTPGIVMYQNPGSYDVTLSAINEPGGPAVSADTRTIEVLADPGSVPDLRVTQLDLPDNLEVGIPTTITYSVQNIGDGAVSGANWIDAIYLSEDPFLGGNDQFLGSLAVDQDLQPDEIYTQNLDIVIPTAAEQAYYVIVSADDQWDVLERHQLNNELAEATDVRFPRLEDEVPRTAALADSGASHYYRVDVPSSSNLRIALDDVDDLGVNELYVRFGELPTRGTYDYRGTAMASADQETLIPAAYAGAWYVLVYAELAVGAGEYTIEADIVGLELTDVTPDHHGAGADAVLTLTGAGFDATTTVELVAPDDTAYAADLVELDSFTQMTVTFAAGAVPAGLYSVRASQTDGDTDELTDAFQVITGGEAVLETNLIVPSFLGNSAPATIYVEYANTGDLAMPAPLLVLEASQGGVEGAIMTLDPSLRVQGSWSSAMPEGFSNTIQFLASGETPGVLQPGESFRVPVYWAGWQQPWSASNFEFRLGSLSADDTTPVDWNTLKPEMRPDTISEEAWEAIWSNFVAEVGTTWGDYLTMLDENAAYLGRLGQQVLDVGQLLGFEFLQADGLAPVSYLASGLDAWAESPGLPLAFGRRFPQAISQRYETGPLGRGWSHNWDYSLDVGDDGTVTINGPGGTRRVFLPDIRGGYFSQPGDYATLTDLGGGAFSLREKGGLLTEFRSDGKLDYVEDTNGNRITAGYSGEQLTSLTHSSGATLLLDYDAQGMITSVTDPLGPGDEDDRVTVYSYDTSAEHLESVQRYDQLAPTYYQYVTGQGPATEHALSEIEYPGNTHKYFTYDANGWLFEAFRDEQAEKVTLTYGSSGKVSATDAVGETTDYFFDHRALLVKVENALDNAVHFTIDNQYNLLEITGPTGLPYSFDYDPQGNLIRSIDALGNSTSFAYEGPYNRMTTLTDANGNLTQYGYDAQGNQTSITYADLTQEQVGYDTVGNPTEWANRRGAAVGYTYDDFGRLTRKDYQDSSFVQYVYDSHGNLTSATDPTGTTTFNHDPTTDRLERITYPGGRWLEFTYDLAGRRSSSLDQLGHRLDYHYDAAGRLESITDTAAAEIVRYHYDAAGRLERKDLGNGVYTTYQYDAASHLLRLDNFAPDDSELSHFHYTYDMLGRRTSMDTHYGLWTYEYDDIGQLTHAVLDSSDPQISDQDLTYVYDALGNRIRTVVNGETAEYTTNNMNQYTQVGDTTYEFDADGNLIRETSPEGTTTYTYDDENRLVAVSASEGDWEYVYDAFGDRVAATENGVTTNYVVDPAGYGNVVAEYDSGGSLLAHYTHGFGLLTRTDVAGASAYYAFDAIGSTSELTDSSGDILNSYTYDPFGRLLSEVVAVPNPFQFVGKYGVMHETNGLEFMRARFYDAATGRFVSEDPVGLLGGMNFYSYAKQNPTSLIDPSGLLTPLQKIGLGVVGILGTALVATATPVLVTIGIVAGVGSTLASISETVGTGMGGGEVDGAELGMAAVSLLTGGISGGAGTLLSTLVSVAGMAGPVGELSGQGTPPASVPPNPPDSPPSPDPPVPPTDETDNDDAGNSASRDPNEKTGPGGYGDAGYIVEDTLLSYRVDFENDATATAPAQVVTVTDQLDSDIDWTTFELTEIGFGDQLLAVPAGSQHFETSVPMSYEGVDFEVQIDAGIRAATGEVFANFYSIDPDTGLPPVVTIGFLPPEDDTGRGMGHFNYIVRPKTGLPTGTEIRNIAIIQFDFGEIIATNQIDPHDPSQGTDPAKEALNTIDATIPENASHVLPLPATTAQTEFLVEWTGQDDPGGSGIGSYDVYFRVDDEPYVLWLDDTDETSAVFTGKIGNTYAFYSIATDNVGHSEEPPTVPDAQTRVTVRLGAVGDSLGDEYSDQGFGYAENWVELLAEVKQVDFGMTDNWGEPRRDGYEYNWARAGATSQTLVDTGQHTALAQQINDGLIDYAIAAIGQNDFAPGSAAYTGIYSGTWTQAQTDAYASSVVDNIDQAVQTLTTTGGNVVMSNIIDYGVAPLTRSLYTNPDLREQVTTVIQAINDELAALAQQYDVPLVDLFGLTKDYLGSNHNPADYVTIGGVQFVNSGAVDPSHLFVEDGIHPHTVVQAMFGVNPFLEAVHLGYGEDVSSLAFTEQEAVEIVGLTYGGSDTLGIDYADYVILPSSMSGDIHMVLRKDPSAFDKQTTGEVDSLPNSEAWIDEWASFYVEVWVSTPDTDATGVVSAQVDLTYNTDYFTATGIEYGPGFDLLQIGTIDDAAGVVDNLGAGTLASGVGDDQYALLARVRFEPAVDGPGVPLGADGKYITPVNIGFGLDNAQITLVGNIAADVELGTPPDTELWPVMYDIDDRFNDNGLIDFGDFTFFATAFAQDVEDGSPWYVWASDFDRSGLVDFGDFTFFAMNFGKGKTDGVEIRYPGNFPEAWRPNPLTLEVPLAPPQGSASLVTDQKLDPIVSEAMQRLNVSEGSEAKAVLDNVTVEVVDLPGNQLGQSLDNRVWIDLDAAGYGRFIDATPGDEVEFSRRTGTNELMATSDSRARGQVDLLTTLMHEFGHMLGYEHNANDDAMHATLPLSTRRLPGFAHDTENELKTMGLLSDSASVELQKDGLFSARKMVWQGARLDKSDSLLWNPLADEQEFGDLLDELEATLASESDGMETLDAAFAQWE